MEETGVVAKFECILALRDVQHMAPFDVSDIYMVCLLRAEED